MLFNLVDNEPHIITNWDVKGLISQDLVQTSPYIEEDGDEINIKVKNGAATYRIEAIFNGFYTIGLVSGVINAPN